jgi:hypothetical protein
MYEMMLVIATQGINERNRNQNSKCVVTLRRDSLNESDRELMAGRT